MTILLIFSACSTSQTPTNAELAPEERVWMEKFFKDVMLDNTAVYTLWGSKPMTDFDIHYHSEVEVRAFFDGLSEEEKKNTVVVKDYDLPENWEKWEQIRSKYRIRNYLFFKTVDLEDPKFARISFVNIKEMAFLLVNHYTTFKRETGMDFDPLKVVFEIERGSEFWNKALNNSVLVGLLYGFGLENSCSFKWKHGKHPAIYDDFCNSLKFRFSDHNMHNASIAHFSLPIFASFSEGKDEVIEKYKNEREMIRQSYRGKDFLNLTLEKLQQ